MLKSRVPKFPFDLSVRFRDIAEKQIPAKLKSIVRSFYSVHVSLGQNDFRQGNEIFGNFEVSGEEIVPFYPKLTHLTRIPI